MRTEHGFTYLGVLLSIAMLGISLSVASELWVTTVRRQRLAELDFAGRQFVQAIASYHEGTPGPIKALPKTLDDLLEDRRGPVVRRHLRRIFLNPFSGSPDWQVILAPDGGIEGIEALAKVGEGKDGVDRRRYVYSAVPRSSSRISSVAPR